MFCCVVADASAAQIPSGAIEAIARACSPRVAPCGQDAVVFDVDGLSRACGPPAVIAEEVARMAREHGLVPRVAVSDTMTAAWVLAHARPGVTVACGETRRTVLGELPTSWLVTVCELDRSSGRVTRHQLPHELGGATVSDEGQRRARRPTRPRHFRGAPSPAHVASSTIDDGRAAIGTGGPARQRLAAEIRQQRALCLERLATFERWGIRTCAALGALPRADIHARMGPVGVRLHQAAHGEDVAPLVPADERVVFADRVVLDWPIEGLEPLAFVLARQCERLSLALERADRGAVTLHTTLTLVTRERHVRELALPAPLREARVMRTLIMLDLESHPPTAGIDVVELRLDVTPDRILQGSLLTWAVPTLEDLSTLVARLGALVGDTRVGAPICPDTHDARQMALVPFRVPPETSEKSNRVAVSNAPSLRRFRLPVAARVSVEHGAPAAVWPSAKDLPGGRVVMSAGPWRSSGSWWTDDRSTWDRDEWDVELASGELYRLARVRPAGVWEIEGVFD